MIVIYLLHDHRKSGANRSLLTLLDAIMQDVVPIVVLPQYGDMVKELETRSIRYHIVRHYWWMHTKRNLVKGIFRCLLNTVAALRIAYIAKREHVEIIHTNSSVIPVGAIAAKLAGIKHVWHIREFGEEDFGLCCDLGRGTTWQLIRLLGDSFIAVSEAIKQHASQRLRSSKISVVYNPVVLPQKEVMVQESLLATIGHPLLIAVGSLVPGKGQIDAVKAVASLLQDGIKANLLLVGDGDHDYKKQLERVAVETGIRDRVHFLGYLDNVIGIGAGADIHLVCSRSEAFGRVTAEAMLLGKPVIAAKTGGTRELVEDGRTGYFYEVGNADDLARKIAYVLTYREKAMQTGENAKQWAACEFDPISHAERIIEIYRSLV